MFFCRPAWAVSRRSWRERPRVWDHRGACSACPSSRAEAHRPAEESASFSDRAEAWLVPCSCHRPVRASHREIREPVRAVRSGLSRPVVCCRCSWTEAPSDRACPPHRAACHWDSCRESFRSACLHPACSCPVQQPHQVCRSCLQADWACRLLRSWACRFLVAPCFRSSSRPSRRASARPSCPNRSCQADPVWRASRPASALWSESRLDWCDLWSACWDWFCQSWVDRGLSSRGTASL